MFTLLVAALAALVLLPSLWPWLLMPVARLAFGGPVAIVDAEDVTVFEAIDPATGEVVWSLEVAASNLLPVLA